MGDSLPLPLAGAESAELGFPSTSSVGAKRTARASSGPLDDGANSSSHGTPVAGSHEGSSHPSGAGSGSSGGWPGRQQHEGAAAGAMRGRRSSAAGLTPRLVAGLLLLTWCGVLSVQYRLGIGTSILPHAAGRRLAGTAPDALSAAAGGERPAAGSRARLLQQTLASRGRSGEGYLAICASVKDQQLDVREWVAYHHMAGVERFYIVDPGSSPPLSGALAEEIASGLVVYTYGVPAGVKPKPGAKGPQTAIYDWCLQQYGPRHEWMAFIDADEFLVLRNGVQDLPTLLRQHEDSAGGLVVNWQIFGSSGHENRPRNNTLLAYTSCLPRDHPHNAHVKSIVRPERTRETYGTPHTFLYHEPWHAVNTRRERVDTVRTSEMNLTVAQEQLVLHHYVTKSLYDYWLKRARGSGMGNQKDLYYFNMVDRQANETCLEGREAGLRLAALLGQASSEE